MQELENPYSSSGDTRSQFSNSKKTARVSHILQSELDFREKPKIHFQTPSKKALLPEFCIKASLSVLQVTNGGAFRVNSEPSPFFTRDVTDILEIYIKLDYSLHSLLELLGKPRDMKRFVIL